MVQVIGSAAQDPVRAAHRPVGRDREPVAVASVEELGEGVLKDRERTRFAEDVAQQLGKQGRLAGDSSSRRWLDGSLLELVRGQRQDVHDAGAEPLCEGPIGEWPVVGVCSECDHREDAALRIVDRRDEVREEALALPLVSDESEQLFELIDDEHQS